MDLVFVLFAVAFSVAMAMSVSVMVLVNSDSCRTRADGSLRRTVVTSVILGLMVLEVRVRRMSVVIGQDDFVAVVQIVMPVRVRQVPCADPAAVSVMDESGSPDIVIGFYIGQVIVFDGFISDRAPGRRRANIYID